MDARDARGRTALQHAATRGDVKEIEALLARGAAIDAASPDVYDGATAFELALQFSKPEAAKLLLDRGASTAGVIGDRALALAGREGAIEILDLLLARGVTVKGSKALPYAARYGRTEAIAKLVKAGAEVNAPDLNDHLFTPLMIACMENQLAAAKALLDAGARVNDVDDDQSSVLHWAVFAAAPAAIRIYPRGGGPHATVFRPHASAPLVELLLARGAKINATDDRGDTALHKAAMYGAEAAARVLVRRGAKRAARNHEGKTALELAQDRKNSVVDVLAPPRAP